MKKVLTAGQMREVDRLSTERYGIASIDLMENAATAVADVIEGRLGGSVVGRSILVLCGRGNNGGDGLALARILLDRDAFVRVLLFAAGSDLTGDARINFERLTTIKAPRLDIKDNTSDLRDVLAADVNQGSTDIYVDSLFGTGVTRPLVAPFSEIIEILSAKADRTVSIDIPSGLASDRAEPIGPNVRAAATVTFTSPKPANVLAPACRYGGMLAVADIGSPPELIDEQPSQLYLTDAADAAKWLRATAFTDDSYKGKRGHLLIVAGSADYSGAAVLAANAAIRSGTGLVTLASPSECKAETASRLSPEVILSSLESEEFRRQFIKADAIAVGCGLAADDPEIEELVREVIANRTGPVIVDAGALGYVSRAAEMLPKPAPEQGRHTQSSDARATANSGDIEPPLILTPHEGEFLTLLGTKDKGVLNDRVAAVREFATTKGVILVLKGERVLMGHPDGRVVVNPTGNSGLGKAGNGDTLTGILGGFVAQAVKMKVDIFETVVAAVYIAGMAGDEAERQFGKRVMTASDVSASLAAAFRSLETQR